uniref:Uncharacterized protein n=1 Tax=Tanacetum cinerariifolium TaxID=118510 RepID=A0A699HI40_TANCI|nr:hypothetical protein [Tanacetum cinerariifolium]
MLADELDEENTCLKKEAVIPTQAVEGSSGQRQEHEDIPCPFSIIWWTKVIKATKEEAMDWVVTITLRVPCQILEVVLQDMQLKNTRGIIGQKGFRRVGYSLLAPISTLTAVEISLQAQESVRMNLKERPPLLELH